jgi:hypothetical protein
MLGVLVGLVLEHNQFLVEAEGELVMVVVVLVLLVLLPILAVLVVEEVVVLLDSEQVVLVEQQRLDSAVLVVGVLRVLVQAELQQHNCQVVEVVL